MGPPVVLSRSGKGAGAPTGPARPAPHGPAATAAPAAPATREAVPPDPEGAGADGGGSPAPTPAGRARGACGDPLPQAGFGHVRRPRT